MLDMPHDLLAVGCGFRNGQPNYCDHHTHYVRIEHLAQRIGIARCEQIDSTSRNSSIVDQHINTTVLLLDPVESGHYIFFPRYITPDRVQPLGGLFGELLAQFLHPFDTPCQTDHDHARVGE
uniref:Uncharacterized protein n=1 Tax=Anopheles melas TaxID=34690 RepID=A0A182TY43_9DIPT